MVCVMLPFLVQRWIHKGSDIPVRRRIEKALDWPVLGTHKLRIEPFETFLNGKLNGKLNNLVYDYYFDPNMEVRRMIPYEMALGLDDNDDHGYVTTFPDTGGLVWDKNEAANGKVSWTRSPTQHEKVAVQVQLYRSEDVGRDSMPILCDWKSYFFQSYCAEIFRSFNWEDDGDDDDHRWVSDTTIYIGHFKKDETWEMRRFFGSEWDFKVVWNKIVYPNAV